MLRIQKHYVNILKQFLSDTRVIEANRALWWVILNGIILRTRPARSAKLYRRIWTKDGSPLLTITKGQTDAVREMLTEINSFNRSAIWDAVR